MGQMAAQVPCNLVLKSIGFPKESSPFKCLLAILLQSALNSSGQMQVSWPQNLGANLVHPYEGLPPVRSRSQSFPPEKVPDADLSAVFCLLALSVLLCMYYCAGCLARVAPHQLYYSYRYMYEFMCLSICILSIYVPIYLSIILYACCVVCVCVRERERVCVWVVVITLYTSHTSRTRILRAPASLSSKS
jgi:hypothetical protein